MGPCIVRMRVVSRKNGRERWEAIVHEFVYSDGSPDTAVTAPYMPELIMPTVPADSAGASAAAAVVPADVGALRDGGGESRLPHWAYGAGAGGAPDGEMAGSGMIGACDVHAPYACTKGPASDSPTVDHDGGSSDHDGDAAGAGGATAAAQRAAMAARAAEAPSDSSGAPSSAACGEGQSVGSSCCDEVAAAGASGVHGGTSSAGAAHAPLGALDYSSFHAKDDEQDCGLLLEQLLEMCDEPLPHDVDSAAA